MWLIFEEDKEKKFLFFLINKYFYRHKNGYILTRSMFNYCSWDAAVGIIGTVCIRISGTALSELSSITDSIDVGIKER